MPSPEHHPVIGFEVVAEGAVTGRLDHAPLVTWLVEGQPIAIIAWYVQLFLQLELEFDPGMAAAVDGPDPQIEKNSGVLARVKLALFFRCE